VSADFFNISAGGTYNSYHRASG